MIFEPWDEREEAGLGLDSMVARLGAGLDTIQDAQVIPLVPPAIQGLGTLKLLEIPALPEAESRLGAALVDRPQRMRGPDAPV